jgi:hypothetical protein
MLATVYPFLLENNYLRNSIRNCITTIQKQKQNWIRSGSGSATGSAYFLLEAVKVEVEAKAVTASASLFSKALRPNPRLIR